VQAPKAAPPKQAAVAPQPTLGKTAPQAPGVAVPPVQPAAPPVQSHSGVVSGPMRPMAPPRAMAKAEIFVDGDFVVYPTHGVGKVERIAIEEIAGHKLELIHITFDENRMTLRVPTNKARTAGLRKLASQKQFDEVLATLKGRARIKRTMWSRRAQEYEAKINSGDPSAIAEVVRDLHRNAGQPDQSFSERQIYESALDRLAAEYAALEKVDKPTAIERLIAHLKSD
jgi:CarD family transcriptional regulator